MTNYFVDADGFGAAMTEILEDVHGHVKQGANEAVEDGLKVAKKEWKQNARSVLSKSYVLHGREIKTGRYARSISHKMNRKGDSPAGEVGSRSLPGLPHLLEKGHAKVGGGRVPGREHIAPAAETAFDATMEAMEKRIGEKLGS